jgi:DNA polymerase-1
MIDPITVDFETEAIVGNPIVNPPKPVGVAIWVPGQEPFYMAWGHPTGNTHKEEDAGEYLGKLVASNRPLLFHNAGFDLSVWNKWFIRHRVPMHGNWWSRIHDTMYLLFLADPYASTLSLKPSADRYLGMSPDEQDDVHQWILNNVPEATKKSAGAFIARAPGDLVGRYAIGDVVRTRKLFDLLHARIAESGMGAAYDRERRLFPLVYGGTCRGIRIDRDTLDHHTNIYTKCLTIAEERLATRLGISPSALDHDESLADGLERAGAVTEWTLTKTGKRSMSKDNLKISIPDVKILMDYRSGLQTCLQTFMRPWLEFSKHDGRLHPNWNQVKQTRGGGGLKGTQTGRLSSDSPNFQNVPTQFTDLLGNPLPVPEGLHPLPQLRLYCLPEVGHVWLKRDFSSQEIRILAHFEDGSLCEAYKADPTLDPHQMARDLINSMIGIMYARKDVKITGFSIIYGSGVNGLSGQLQRPYHEAAEIKEAYLSAMPGVRGLMRDVQRRGRAREPIRTWGGRIYYAEPSKEVDGRIWDFSYKLLNYLIQGSAADQTKESLCDWDAGRDRSKESIFLATVHDEINISAKEECWEDEMKFLTECMNADRFDVPMLSEGFVGPNWCDLKECA